MFDFPRRPSLTGPSSLCGPEQAGFGADPFDPRTWEWELPYRKLYLSDRDDSRWCIVDHQDWEWAQQWLWLMTHPHQDGKYKHKQYAARTLPRRGPRDMRGPHQLVWLHKEVLLRSKGPPPSPLHIIGDHWNGNSLDNRRCNLRWATEQENNRNKYGKAWRQLFIEGV